jgi:hypothetical protein
MHQIACHKAGKEGGLLGGGNLTPKAPRPVVNGHREPPHWIQGDAGALPGKFFLLYTVSPNIAREWIPVPRTFFRENLIKIEKPIDKLGFKCYYPDIPTKTLCLKRYDMNVLFWRLLRQNFRCGRM